MPNREPTTLVQDKVRLRHIGPKASVLPDTAIAVQEFTVLSQSTMVAAELPSSPLPTSPDLATGSWTGRLGDAGEGSFAFPNAVASDGIAWRSRFDPTGHLQFLEVYFDGELDFVGVIDQVAPSQQQVGVHAYDGWWLLKKAYERDWIVTQAPRDVIERGTQVWVPVVADNFPYNGGALSSQWNFSVGATLQPNGGVLLSEANTAGAQASIQAQVVPVALIPRAWRATTSIQWSDLGASSYVFLEIDEESGNQYQLGLYEGHATFYATIGASFALVDGSHAVDSAASYTLTLESDGEWVWAFVNGALINCVRRDYGTVGTSLSTTVGIQGGGGSPATIQALVTGALVETLQPFLMPDASPDRGDYVLPGDASTYPWGGLHARYFNDLDLASDSNRLWKIGAPSRTQAYGGSGTAEYANQQDAAINGQTNPTPGAATSNWSCVWFGAIYLKLSDGSYTMAIDTQAGGASAVRVWVGKTAFGAQLVDEWSSWVSGTQAFTFTVDASSLSGALPYGQGTVARDGWYPIKVEYAVDATALTAPALYFAHIPAAYTDPGGTALAAGAQNTVVPSTSLSPLGCADQRYQGIAHFDLVQQTVQAYGYQASVEPKQLESGLFPGVLAPRVREGHDTDIILKPDHSPRQDGEGLLNYSSTLDASDFAASLQGNGAGFQSGTTGQLQARVYDSATMLGSLFDAQAWQDFADASFISLLQALLNSQLGLQLTPWQLLSADPNGRPRRAFTWPLPGEIQDMRWRPGDGVRIQALDIDVDDTTPRQMLVVTRNLAPYGITGTTATFANRPKNPAHTLKRQLYAATRLQRNYQRQKVSINSPLVQSSISAGTLDSSSCFIALTPGDQIISAQLRVTANSAAQSFDVYASGTNVTSTLNGPWAGVPLLLDVTGVMTPKSSGVSIQLYNAGSSGSSFVYQLFVDVLR